MEISIKTIPHSEQRYPTCGDYWTDAAGVLQMRISEMGNVPHQKLVMIHELIEQMLCEKAGTSNDQIDGFDMGAGADLDDPGSTAAAPYHHQHMIATGVEMMLCSVMGLSWEDYEMAIQGLGGAA